MPGNGRRGTERLGDFGLVSVVVAAVCCAGLPPLGALLGGPTIAALPGAGAALLVGAQLALALTLLRAWRRPQGRR